MEFSYTAPADPLAAPLMADLLREYTERYGPGASREFDRHPIERFSPENGGAFLLLMEGDEAVAGGAFMRTDAGTAEVKRMWTHPDHRRRGLAASVLTELEAEATRRGYRRMVLSTGPRQPEAVALYTALGYELTVDPQTSGYYAFAKLLRRLGFFSRVLDDAPAAERYRLGVEQIVEAERLGFDTAWVAQHHFNGDEGGMPSPLVFLANAAARTTRIRLGTSTITLPLELPVRVAEDAAVLDALSGGRVELGVGSGGTPSSFAAFGLDPERRRDIHRDNLAVLLDALAGRPLPGTDRPLHPDGRRLLGSFWQATFSVDGATRIGAAGHGLMLSRTQPRDAGTSLADVQRPIVAAYLDALPAGTSPRIMASRSLFASEDADHAATRARAGIARWAAAARVSGVSVPALPEEALLALYDVNAGTPEQLIDALRADDVLAQATDIVFQVHPVDPPHDEILHSLELIATQIAPALGWSPAR